MAGYVAVAERVGNSIYGKQPATLTVDDASVQNRASMKAAWGDDSKTRHLKTLPCLSPVVVSSVH